MSPSGAAGRHSPEASSAGGKSPAGGGFLFVQYPSDARLGRKHLQSKSMKEHLSRRRRIQKIHKFRNVNVPVAPSTSGENEQGISADVSYNDGLPTPKSLPPVGLAHPEIQDTPLQQRIDDASQELWDVLDWEPFHAARAREQASFSTNGKDNLSPRTYKSGSTSSFDGHLVIRPKTPSSRSDRSGDQSENVNTMDPWNTGWTMLAAIGSKVPVKMDSEAYTILQHRTLPPVLLE